MKRIFIYFLTLSFLLLSACSPKEKIEKEPYNTVEAVITTKKADITESSQETEMTAGISPTKETGSDLSSGQDPGPSNENSSDPTESSASSKPSVTAATRPVHSDTADPTEQMQTEPSTETLTEPPSVSYATETDVKEIASKIVEYINKLRVEEGVPAAIKLPGLTTYAEYRSRQLVTNFAHDTLDERAAATALQYGEYVDPSIYNIPGEPYYTSNSREAIAYAGYFGSVDYVAKSLAEQVKNSAGHWAYVGSSRYGYIAVGVTRSNGLWYCDIAMADENTDEL